jgi:hypothetical protein
MPRVFIAILAAGLMPVICLPASAHSHTAKRRHVPEVKRDCTPINGFYGYYGNPWCDTGSSRPPDIEFRERQNFNRRHSRDVYR